MIDYPDPKTIRRMRDWCSANRGSVRRIADSVIQRDGSIGVHHSAVVRTLAGRERNSRVLLAFAKVRRSYPDPQ